jgi:hypothetical protein
MKKQTQKAQNIKVIKNEEKPETPEILAEAIIAIGKGFEMFSNSRLTQRAIITLLLDMPELRAKISRSDVELVLNNLPKLSSYYIKK